MPLFDILLVLSIVPLVAPVAAACQPYVSAWCPLNYSVPFTAAEAQAADAGLMATNPLLNLVPAALPDCRQRLGWWLCTLTFPNCLGETVCAADCADFQAEC